LLDNRVSKEGVRRFAQLVQKNTSLMRLSITAVLNHNAAMDEDFEDLRNYHRVRRAINRAENGNARLDLVDVKLGAAGTKQVAETIEKSQTLLGLNLDHCEIGDEEAARIAQALETNASILEVSLAGNEIGNVGAQRLMEVLKQNQTIYDMDLSGNPLGGDVQLEVDNHASSRVAFGIPSSDSFEKCLSTMQCHANLEFPSINDLAGRPQRPTLSRQPSQARVVLLTEPLVEEGEDEDGSGHEFMAYEDLVELSETFESELPAELDDGTDSENGFAEGMQANLTSSRVSLMI